MTYRPGYRRKRPTEGPVTALTLRLPPKLRKALDVQAAERGISLAAYVRGVLAKHLQKIQSTK